MTLSLRCLLATCMLLALASGLASAQTEALDPEQLVFNEDGTHDRFKSQPAETLLSKDEHDAYVQALLGLDCAGAGSLLNLAFIRTYPQFRRARWRSDCEADRDCAYWNMYARGAFDEYAHCWAVSDLTVAEIGLRQNGVSPPHVALKPWSPETSYDNKLVEQRDKALEVLIMQAQLNYMPALEKLAELLQRGDVFAVDDEPEYYIRIRICHFGGDCERQQERLAVLRARMPPDRVKTIDDFMAWGYMSMPVLHRLLLGERM